MPHLIVEYSEQQARPEQLEAMLDALHSAAAASGLFDESHIRVRAIPISHFRNGGGRGHFIHAQCRIHSGRDEEQKGKLSAAVLEALKAQQWPAGSITVEVVEMDRASYAKYLSE